MSTTEVFRLAEATPRAARTFVGGVIGDRACRAAAELVVSELVSNVIIHAADARSVEVAVRGGDDVVRIEVTQHGVPVIATGIQESPAWPAASELSGRGLRIVDALADRWGVDAGARTTVWCELSCRPGGRAATV